MTNAGIAQLMRVCTECCEAKPATLEYFSPLKIGKFGLQPRCRPCKRAKEAEWRSRPDQKERQKKWRDSNKQKVKLTNKAYRASGYSSTLAVAKWREENKDYARREDARRMRDRRSSDPNFRLLCRLRARLRSMLRSRGGRSTQSIFPFTMPQLRQHLEKQFLKGMNWENAHLWHIDHITPVSAFSISSVDDPDFRRCWSLQNLRPLWAVDNLRKSNKIEVLI